MSLSQAHIIGGSPLPPPGTVLAVGPVDEERPNASFPPVLSALPRRRLKLLRVVLARLLLSGCSFFSLQPPLPPCCWVGVSSKLGAAAPLLISPPPSLPTIVPLPLCLRSPSPVGSGLVLGRVPIGDSGRGCCSPWWLLAGEVGDGADRRSARPDTRWRGSFSLRIRAISGLYTEDKICEGCRDETIEAPSYPECYVHTSASADNK